jgi:hypothetical protein
MDARSSEKYGQLPQNLRIATQRTAHDLPTRALERDSDLTIQQNTTSARMNTRGSSARRRQTQPLHQRDSVSVTPTMAALRAGSTACPIIAPPTTPRAEKTRFLGPALWSAMARTSIHERQPAAAGAASSARVAATPLRLREGASGATSKAVTCRKDPTRDYIASIGGKRQ